MTVSNLFGRVVIITGAGRGLGRGYALALSAAGASVIVNDVNAAAAEETAQLVIGAGGTAMVVAGSVADAELGPLLVSVALSTFGRLDGIVANAGVVHTESAFDLDLDAVRYMFEVNVLGLISTVVPTLRHLRDAGSGGSVLVDTSGSRLGIPGMAAYGATKGAAVTLALDWAIEGAPHNIRVNVLSPLALTQMTLDTKHDPAGHGTVEEVARAVPYFFSDDSEGVTGQIFRHTGSSFGWFGSSSKLAVRTTDPGEVDDMAAYVRAHTELLVPLSDGNNATSMDAALSQVFHQKGVQR